MSSSGWAGPTLPYFRQLRAPRTAVRRVEAVAPLYDRWPSAAMSIPATIRCARASDAAAIESLIQRYVPSGTLLPRSREFIAERAIDFLVATLDRRVIGCVHLYEYSPSIAEVRSLAVDPAYQGRGVGSALVDAIEHLAGQREYATLFAVSQNEAFFRRRGYLPREIPELDRERSEVSRFKGVYARDLAHPATLLPVHQPTFLSWPTSP